MKSLGLVACLFLVFPLAGSAQNLLLNPSFESGIIGPHNFGLIPGDCEIDFWNVGFVYTSDFGEVGYLRSDSGAYPTAFGLASEGAGFAAISAEGFGRSLYQVFATTPGQAYRASIDIRFQGFVTPGYATVVSVLDLAETELGTALTLATEANTFENLESSAAGWSRYSLDFVATGSAAKLVLFTTSDAGMDSLLSMGQFDAASVVALSAVPEPSSYAALAGLAALGLVALCHRRRPAAA